jgi:hypothetical protein
MPDKNQDRIFRGSPLGPEDFLNGILIKRVGGKPVQAPGGKNNQVAR